MNEYITLMEHDSSHAKRVTFQIHNSEHQQWYTAVIVVIKQAIFNEPVGKTTINCSATGDISTDDMALVQEANALALREARILEKQYAKATAGKEN